MARRVDIGAKSPSTRRGEGRGEGVRPFRRGRYTFTQPSPSRERAIACEQNFSADHFEHAVGVGKHVVVPEAQHAVAERFNHFGSRCVSFAPMLTSIQLDSEARIATGEICDVRADRDLTDEFGTFELARSEVTPKALLGIRAVSAELPRNSRQALTRHGRTPSPNPLPAGERALLARHTTKTDQEPGCVNA